MSIDLLKLTPQPQPAAEPVAKGASSTSGAGLAGEFEKIFGEQMQNLIGVTQKSEQLDRDFAAGKSDNIAAVMVAGAEAGLAVETALQVRNMALRMYQTLTQLR